MVTVLILTVTRFSLITERPMPHRATEWRHQGKEATEGRGQGPGNLTVVSVGRNAQGRAGHRMANQWMILEGMGLQVSL